jgi:hypothetical protein
VSQPRSNPSTQTIVHLNQSDRDKVRVADRGIPRCLFPLRTPGAQTEYDTLVQLLLAADKLSADAHRTLSEYASQFDALHVSLRQGSPVRPSCFDQLRRARKALRLQDLEQPSTAPEETPRPNKFARCGFASRGRQQPAILHRDTSH